MEKDFIRLLNSLLKKLDDTDFDLEAWKSGAIPLLETIFGNDNPKVRQIKPIRIEYGSSWTMRDVTGDYDPVGSAKKRCRETINMAIDELETIGVPERNGTGSRHLVEALEAELKVAQIKSLKKILEEDKSDDEKQMKLNEKLASFGNDTLSSILAKMILREGISE